MFYYDKFELSNLNRQIISLFDNIGKNKVEVAKERIESINKSARVNIYETFYTPETAEQFDFSQYDYVVDAIDTVTGKVQLVLQAKEAGNPIISSMGAGNKINPAMFEVADIYKTSVCPLAKVMRHELKKRGIKKLKVVYSKEKPITPMQSAEEEAQGTRRSIPGSTAFVPSTVGLIIAGEVVKDILGFYNKL